MIRFLKVSAPYPDFLAHAYARDLALAGLPYDQQLRRLMEWRFAYSDFWQRHLAATGLYDTAEFLGNAIPLQRRWAQDQGITADPSTREGAQAVLAAQIAEYRPEVLFLHGGQYVTPGFRRQLRQQVPSIRLIVGYDGIAENSADRFAGCDVVLACLETSVAYYQRAGFRSRLIKNAFEPSMIEFASGIVRDLPVSFVGAVTFGSGKHGQRAQFLAELSRRLDAALHLRMPSVKQYFRGFAREIVCDRRAGAVWDCARQWRDFRALTRVDRGLVCGVDMYRELARAQIALNIHIDAAGSAAANMRLFEATGMGACLVTDWKPNLSSLFEEDREVVAFRSTQECFEKVRYLLDHPLECASIAERGRQRCLKDHRLDVELRSVGEWLASL